MTDLQQALQRGAAFLNSGQLSQAEAIYRRILIQQPDHPQALYLLGVIAHRVGKDDIAVDLIGRAIAADPSQAQFNNTYGSILISLGRAEEAITVLQRAVELDPTLAEAHNNLGRAFCAERQLAEGEAALRQAVALRPDFAEALFNLAILLNNQGKIDQATACFREAVKLSPNSAAFHFNLAVALRVGGKYRPDEVELHLRSAIQLQPDYAPAYNELGNVLFDQLRLDEAIGCYHRAISINDGIAEFHNNLGNAYRAQANLDQAIVSLRRAIELAPDNHHCYSNYLYSLYYHPDYENATIGAEHDRWQRHLRTSIKQSTIHHANDRSPERRLRVGYIAPDFKEHCQSFFTMPLLSNHDHKQFEIICYADVPRPDDVTRRLQNHADIWRKTVGVSHDRLAEIIRDDRIDILVDLTLHTSDNRLLTFARKPAPVQMTWLGYPGTTGLETIDYRLTDPYLDPPGLNDAFYSEESIRLPNSYWCYDPLTSEPAVNCLPADANGSITFGCLNNFCKVNAGVLKLWAQVMRAVPNSRLLLLCPQGDHRNDVLAKLEGIAPQRVEFVEKKPRSEYLKLYHRIDLCLDTFPYNAHTTALDAYWMGVPTVTLVGRTAVGRAGLSQLSNLGLTELVAHNQLDFVRITQKWAGDLPRLAALRSTLRARMQASPLMNGARFARDIEAAYRQMWRRWCG